MKKISMFLRNQPPGRMIVGGFAGVILFGMILLLLPISVKMEQKYLPSTRYSPLPAQCA